MNILILVGIALIIQYGAIIIGLLFNNTDIKTKKQLLYYLIPFIWIYEIVKALVETIKNLE